MRSLGLLIFSILCIGLVFCGYLWLQAPVVVQKVEKREITAVAPSTGPVKRPGDGIVGTGEGAWVQTFDKSSGKLVNEFQALKYEPPKDGMVHMIKPKARFYNNDGTVMQIVAEDGDVVMPQSTKKDDSLNSIQAEQPQRGTLNNVRISMFDNEQSTDPTLTCDLPIIAFDNDTLRMNTVDTRIDNRDVLADRVPVTVRGRDYDFDGEGLLIRWNQRDSRLELLEVAHGKRLVLKNSKLIGSVGFLRAMDRDDPMFVDASDASAKQEAENRRIKRERILERQRQERERAAATQRTSTRDRYAYRAQFGQDVVISEAGKQIGSADTMLALFSFEEDKSTEQPTTPTAGKPTTRKAHKPTTAPENDPATTKPDGSTGPIEIAWTGPLRVTPVLFAESGLTSVKDRIIDFTGAPVKLDRNGSQLRAARLRINDDGDQMLAESSDIIKQVQMRDPNGFSVTTSKVSVKNNIATLTGASSAEMTQNNDQGQPQTLTTRWTKSGVLHLVEGAGNSRSIDHALFDGDVRVDHPQMTLRSQTLELSFLTPAPGSTKTQPQLEQVHAVGQVTSRLTDPSGKLQTIAADDLKLITQPQPDGKIVLKNLKANGHVVTQDETQKLSTDDLSVTLVPVTMDAQSATSAVKMDVEKLVAQGNVHFNTASGTTATADDLSMEKKGDSQLIKLMGAPASVGDQGRTINGKIIVIDSKSQSADIAGAGALDANVAMSEGGKAQPIHMTWTDSFRARGNDNKIDIEGHVHVISVADDGSVNTATGSKLSMILADSEGSTTLPSTTPPADASAIFGGSKHVKSIELTDPDTVEMNSILSAPDGTIIKRIHVFSKIVTMNTAPDGRLTNITIPAGGRMLYDDRRPNADSSTSTTQTSSNQSPTTQSSTTQPSDFQTMRGAVALQWAKSMVYDAAANQAILDGDVIVVHQPPNQDPVQMNCQKLIADLTPATDASNRTTLKQVRADGGAMFRSKQARFDARDFIFDPANNRIIAKGTDRTPVEMYDENGVSTGKVQELWWNIKDQRPERMKNVMAEVRQVK